MLPKSEIHVIGAKLIPFEKEEELQELLVERPDLILGRKRAQHVIRILKELDLPLGKRADVVYILEDGSIYIVETKLRSNSDSRKVVSQILEYYSLLSSNPDVLIFRAGLTDELAERVRKALVAKAANLVIAMDALLWLIESEIRALLEVGLVPIRAVEISRWMINGKMSYVVRSIESSGSVSQRRVITESDLVRNYRAAGAGKFIDSLLPVLQEIKYAHPDRIGTNYSEKFVAYDIVTPLTEHPVRVWFYAYPEDKNQGGLYSYSPQDDSVLIKLARKYGLPTQKPNRRKTEYSYGKVVPFPKTVEEQNALAEKYASLIKSLAGGDPHK